MGIAMARGRSSEEGNSRSRGSKGGGARAMEGKRKSLDALGLFDRLFLVVLTFRWIPCPGSPEWKSKLRIIIKKRFFPDPVSGEFQGVEIKWNTNLCDIIVLLVNFFYLCNKSIIF